jgi:hypothetical protein
VVISFLTGTGIAVFASLVLFTLYGAEHVLDIYRRRANAGDDLSLGESTHDAPRWSHIWMLIFSKLLLGVNDTQLFTGTAVQIVSLVQLCTISIYHFNVVTELAYLSTVTHMLTLVALQRYFIVNRWANSVRVLVMVLNLALLGYTTWFDYALDTLSTREEGTQVACYFSLRKLPLTASSITRWLVLLLMAVAVHFSIFWSMYRPGFDIPPDPLAYFANLPDARNPSHGDWYRWLGTVLQYIVTPAYTVYGLVVGSRVLRNTQAFGSAPVTIIGTEREWGFGQVLAVFLLALVVLPGWEAFFE